MQQLDTAIEHWLNLDGYTHIFIRHSEINSTTDAFYGFRSDVGSGDADAANGSYGLLKETLLSLMTMEQISLGSVFRGALRLYRYIYCISPVSVLPTIATAHGCRL